MKKQHKILILIFLLSKNIYAFDTKTHAGVKVGLSFSFGLQVQRMGLMLGSYFQHNHFQSNVIAHGFYCKKSYGALGKRLELQLSENIIYAFGSKNDEIFPLFLFNPTSNFSNYNFSIGYGLKHYFDTKSTSQSTAMFHLSLHNITLSSENDAFLFSYLDKFRTGTFLLRYNFGNPIHSTFFKYSSIAMKLQMFTGNSLSSESKRINDTSYKSPHGYWDMSETICSNCSHGILSIEAETSLYNLQNAHLQFGIDDERIRNLVQNKWIHNLPTGKTKNPHIPMLQKNGLAYLYKKNERVRKAKPFIQIGANNPLFY